jgi:formate hydrogenlyase transcriptional activator
MKSKPTYQELIENREDLRTELRQAKKTLEEKEKRFGDLVKNAVVGIFRSTEDGRYLLVNKQLACILGYNSPEEFMTLVAEASMIYQNPDDRRILFQAMKEQGTIDGAEVKVRKKNGRIIWVNLSGRFIPQPSGPPIFEGFVVDITDRKRTEKSLQESEERFRMLIEQAGDAFFIHDYNGKIIDINRLACESLGYSRQELLGMTIPDIDIEAGRRGHKPHYWDTLEPRQFIAFEGVHQRRDGSTFPVEVRMSRLDLGGKCLLLSLARDVTERKEAEKRLQHAFTEIKKLKNKLEQENVYLRQEIDIQYNFDEMVGESPAFRKVLGTAEKVAREETCVLILGETGTGKELLARAIHHMSPRKQRPMIKVNCAALPATLIESELFGREKGAFTGAVNKQIGRFEAADGSSIFLDEIGDLPIELQAKLLRVLQDGTFEHLGSSKTISVDVRVIAATNQNLTALVKEKRFRSDLFYRLNVFPIVVPPLRERVEDIPLLALAFVQEYARSMGKPVKQIPKKTMTRMMNYHWPGNIREMRNVIERAMILSSGFTLDIDHPDTEDNSTLQAVTLDEIDRDHIMKTLEETGWRVSGPSGAARRLGLKESTLRWRMRKLGIKRPG